MDVKDLAELTESQKQQLRSLWLPEKYDVAAAYICKDAETDEYDVIEFVVGEVLFYEKNGDKRYAASRVPKVYDYHTITLRSLQLVSELMVEEVEVPADAEEEFNFEYVAPTDYFAMEYCLPLLSIGQMMEILQNHGGSMPDLEIQVSPINNTSYFTMDTIDSNVREEDLQPHDPCASLWACIKSLL